MEGQSTSRLVGALLVSWALIATLSLAGLSGCGGARHTTGKEKTYLHRVEQGETLEDIAEDYYGDPRRASEIMEQNNAEEIEVGMVLRVPMTAKDIDRLKKREEARVPYNKGLELAEHGSFVDAAQQFREALAIDPDFVDASYNLGVAYQKMKSYDRALDQFRRVVRKRPTKPEYSYALGNTYFHMGEYADAARAFENVMANDGTHARAQYSLALSYEKLGRKEDAKQAWRRYLELDSKGVWANEARKHLEELEQ